ncbi:MAG: polyprenyl synthetase family protein [Proteobacteria bacterium]|nr:polyprenyl synthetase family protein [Pseudomonadota bacterium]MCP4920857.1 polyprenyl synthetase family protein [Pseudomonadota bacterium]
MSLQMGSLEAWAAPRREALNARLEALFADAWPAPFTAMAQHPLRTGGKRMRPLMVIGAFEAVGGTDLEQVWPAAMALELVHTYSLVHDDMPCMDDDDERRGKPTTHIVHGDAMALLVGDALLTEAFRLLGDHGDARMVLELAQAAGYHGMIGGQVSDLGGGGPVTDVETLTRLHANKTGKLFRCAVRLGALAGDASNSQIATLTRFAEHFGFAFQLADDVLDADEDAGEDGPPSFVKLMGLDETRRRAALETKEALTALSGMNAEPLAGLASYNLSRKL